MRDQNTLISGHTDGYIYFWDSEGKMTKKINFLNKKVSNLVSLLRPREFEGGLTNLGVVEKRKQGF